MKWADLMEIYVIRHADAGKRAGNGMADMERSLSVSGKKDVETLTRLLRLLEIEADHIISSSLKRARETADILMTGATRKTKRLVWDELNPESSHESFLERVSTLPKDSTIFAVGHNPFLQSMISVLITGRPDAVVELKKCGIARIALDTFDPIPRGELKWLLTPKLEKRILSGVK